MGYDLIITYTKGYESGASLKAAGFFADKFTGRAFKNGTVETLIRWGCLRDTVPGDVEREQTIDMIEAAHEFIYQNRHL